MIGQSGSLAVCEPGEGVDIAVCVVGIGMSKVGQGGRGIVLTIAHAVAAEHSGSALAGNILISELVPEEFGLGISAAAWEQGVEIGQAVEAVVYPEGGGVVVEMVIFLKR